MIQPPLRLIPAQTPANGFVTERTTMPLKLNIIVTSTRPGRVGDKLGIWIADFARAEGSFEVEMIDLADLNLPIYDEPHHPRLQNYQNDHTKKWSEMSDAADAFIFVLPEYNHTAPPSFINAIDFLSKEWAYKAASFVSYGGISGGIRAVDIAKHILTTVKIMPILEQVMVPMVTQHLENDAFVPNEIHTQSADQMLKELKKWAEALKPLRA